MSSVSGNVSFEYAYAPKRAMHLHKQHLEIDDWQRREISLLCHQEKILKSEYEKAKHIMSQKRDHILEKRLELEMKLLAERNGSGRVRPKTAIGQSDFENWTRQRREPQSAPPASRPLHGSAEISKTTEIKQSRPATGKQHDILYKSFPTQTDGTSTAAGDIYPEGLNMDLLTEETRYKLRHQALKGGLQVSQKQLLSKICTFYEELDDFKEECKKAELPKPTTSKSTNSNAMNTLKQIKILKRIELQPQLKKSDDDVETKETLKPWHQATNLGKQQTRPSTGISHRTSTSSSVSKKKISSNSFCPSNSRLPQVLQIDEYLHKFYICRWPAVFEQQKFKLLYQESHDQLNLAKETIPEYVEFSKPKQIKAGSLFLDPVPLNDAFDEFLNSSQNIAELNKMTSVAFKLKHNAKKARERSFVPILSVHKLAKRWKAGALKSHKETLAQSETA